tara:strand:- start:455 stop:1102 length:648 start_codon:yes stop_codon:yes gene_type:complete
MTFIKSLIHKFLNKKISNIYDKRFNNFYNTPKGVFWNSKLSQDLRLNIILETILKNSKTDSFSIADIGCGYGRLYKIIKERNLDGKVEYYGFDISKKLIRFCKNNLDFQDVKFAINAYPFNKTDYVVMSGTYNLTPTNSLFLWESYIIKNLKNNWKFAKKAMIFNCLYKKTRTITKSLYYTELSWIRKICEENFCQPIIIKHQMLKEDITVILKK